VQTIETRLKEIIGQVCQEHQAEVEQLKVMPDYVHWLVSVDPSLAFIGWCN
jgi:putative transposase